MTFINVDAEIDTIDLIRPLSRDHEMTRDNYRGLIQLVLDIDESVCDLQFTKALRDALNEIIDQEES